MIRIEAGSSIPYLGFLWDRSSLVESMISEAGSIQRKQYFFYTAISARRFIFPLFESMGVS
jgi:hypothetical protein